MSSRRTCRKSGLSLPKTRSATGMSTRAYSLSNSNRPRLKIPATLNVRMWLMAPIGVMISSGVSSRTVSPTFTPSVVARSVPRTMPSISSAGTRTASRLPLRIAWRMSVTSTSNAGSMPFTVTGAW